MDTSSFKDAAISAGMLQISNLATIPGLINDMVEMSAKKHAQLLKKSFKGVKLSSALEAVSKALGYQHWHEFHEILQKTADNGHSDQRHLIRALPLLIRFNEVPSINSLQDQLLRGYAGRLSSILNIDRSRVLDMIADFIGSNAYSEVKVFEQVSEFIMFKFVPFKYYDPQLPVSGTLVAYPSFADTIQFIQDILSNVDFRNPKESEHAKKIATQIINAQPFNAYALRLLAEIAEYNDGDTYEYYLSALKLIDASLPEGFNGKVNEHDGDSYLRYEILCRLVITSMVHGNLQEGIQFAQMAFQQSESDGMGVRYLLISLYAFTHQHDKAAGLIKQLRLGEGERDGADKHLLSMCAFAKGDELSARKLLVNAALLMPALRRLVEGSDLVPWDNDWNRPINQDMAITGAIHFTANVELDGYQAFCNSVLSDPQLKAEELRLADIYRGERRNGNHGRWIGEVAKALASIHKASIH